MSRYRLAGLTVESDLPLPELPPTTRTPSDCRLSVETPMSDRGAGDWDYRCESDDGVAWLTVARTPSGYLLRFPNLADYLVSADGRDIVCRAAADAPRDTVRHLLLDQVFPRALTRFGRLVLHGSAVALAAGAVGFLGDTGLGKSTLTAALAVRGCPLLTDDCLSVVADGGRQMAIPSYPGLRLHPDTLAELALHDRGAPLAHYTSKRRLAAAETGLPYDDRPTPLARLYLLTPPDDGGSARDAVAIEPLSAAAACGALLPQIYRLDIVDRATRRAEIDQLSALAARVPVRRLRFRRDYGVMPAVCEAVLADAAASRPTPTSASR